MRYFTFLLSLLLFSSLAHSQRYDWLKVYQSAGFPSTLNQRVATQGNAVFVGGEFGGSITFGTIVLTASQPTGRDLYLAKYDTLGNVIWAIAGGSINTNFDNFRSLTVDSSGNAYISGIFSQTCQWGGLVEQGFYFSTPFSREGFLAKISSSGAPQWIKTFHHPTGTFFSFNSIQSIHAVDDKIIIGGELFNPIEFKGTGVSVSSPVAGQTENFWVGKFDDSGSILSAHVPISENNTGFNSFFFNDFEVIDENEFVISGEINGSFSFGQTTQSVSTVSLFFSKFSHPDSLEWIQTSSNGNPNAVRLGIGPNKEIVFAGTFNTTLSLGGKSINTPHFNQWFTGNLDGAGIVKELKTLDVIGFTQGDVVVNNQGEAYLSGSFRDSVVINGIKRYSFGNTDLLIIKVDTVQDPIWFQTGGGGNSDAVISLAALPSGDVLALSYYRGLAQFGSVVLTGSPTFTPTFLLARLSDCGDFDVPLFFSGDTSFCQGGNVRIFTSSSGGETFQWIKDSIVLAGEVFRDILVMQQGYYQVIVNGSGCIDTSRNVLVSVGTPPTVILPALDSVCLSDTAVALTGGLPIGGLYNGIGVYSDSLFDASIAGIGNTQITYSFSNNGCKDSASSNIFVEPSPTVFFAPLNDVCENSGPQTLTNAFPSGGTFLGTGVNNGIFYPDSAGVGNHVISYVFTSGNGCSNFADQTINVDSPEPIEFDSLPTLCQFDSSLILTRGKPEGGTYFGPGVIGDSFNPTGLPAGNYTLGYIINNQCGIDTAYAAIEVKQSPNVSLSSFPDICIDNGLVNLSGETPSGGMFSGTGILSNSFDPQIGGIGLTMVFYEFISLNGCGSMDSSSILVHGLPSISITSDTGICAGDSIVLFASGGSTYSWSSGQSNSLINVSPLNLNTYIVIVTDSNSCTNMDSVEVDVNAIPSISILGSDSLCLGDTTILLASGGINYLWSHGEQTDSIIVSTDTTKIYSVTGYDIHGCESNASHEIVVKALPNVQFSPLAEICIDNSSILLSGGTPSGGIYSGQGVSGGSFDPQVAGIGLTQLVYEFMDNNGCQNSDTSLIKVNALPMTTISNDTSICLGDTITITASGGQGYSWSNGMIGSSIQVNPSTLFQLFVTVLDSNSCSAQDTVIIDIDSLPIVLISGPSSICFGDTARLLASGANFYSWSTGNITDSIMVSPLATTNFTVTGIDNNGCSNISNQLLNVNILPNVSIAGFPALCVNDSIISLSGGSPLGGNYSGNGVSLGMFNPNVVGPGNNPIFYSWSDSIGCSGIDSSSILVNDLPLLLVNADTLMCLGDSIILNVSGANTYTWSTGEIGSSIVVSPNIDSVYMVTGTDTNLCANSDTVQVDVLDYPFLAVSNDTTICLGSSIVLFAQSNTGNYTWSTGSTTDSTLFTVSGLSFVTVSSSNAGICIVQDSIQVNSHSLPVVNLGVDTVILNNCSDSSYTFQAPTGFSNYLWQNQDTGTSSTIYFFSSQVGLTDHVWIRVTDSNSCYGYDSVVVLYEICTGIKSKFNTHLRLGLYPNPNNGSFQLSIENNIDPELSIRIFDFLGREVFREVITEARKLFTHQIQLGELPSGAYELLLESRSGIKVLSFIKE